MGWWAAGLVYCEHIEREIVDHRYYTENPVFTVPLQLRNCVREWRTEYVRAHLRHATGGRIMGGG